MSGGERRGWVVPLAIGLAVLGVLGCAGLVVLAAGGAAAWLAVAVPTQPATLGGPAGIVSKASPLRTPSPIRVEAPFVYVSVTPVPGEPPARFFAALPKTLAELEAFEIDDPDFPPVLHLNHLVCIGDAETERRILASIRDVHRAGARQDDVEIAYARIFQWCDPPTKACPFFVDVVTGNDPAPVKAPFWTALLECEDEASAAAFERPDVPAKMYIRRFRSRTPAWSKHLEQAAAERIEDGELHEVREAAMTLGATDDPRVAKALVAMYGAEEDQRTKQEIARAMYRQSDPAAKAIFEKLCEGAAGGAFVEYDSVCNAANNAAPAPRATPTLDELLRDHSLDAVKIVADHEKTKRDELVAALERCGEAYSEWQGRRCLSLLAAMEWGSASRIARRMSVPEDRGAVELRQALRMFDDRASLLARLRSDGVLAASDAIDPRVTDIRGLLEHAGRAYEFNADSGYPNEHDVLLRRLAHLARPDLDGILLSETPPPADPDTGEYDGSPYGLDAWLDGRHWRVEARDLGSTYDLEACFGLLNTILESRGSAKRLVALDNGHDAVVAVAGKKEGLLRLARDRLLVTAAPDSLDPEEVFHQQAVDAANRENQGKNP